MSSTCSKSFEIFGDDLELGWIFKEKVKKIHFKFKTHSKNDFFLPLVHIVIKNIVQTMVMCHAILEN